MIREGLKLSHPELANGRWAEMSFAAQMGNLGSEISRALKAKTRGNTERMMRYYDQFVSLARKAA